MEHLFQAGKYYIGDPCYVIADEDWIPLLEKNDYFNDNDGLFEYRGERCWTASTAYGDGCFDDNRGNEYGVDAGLIGILPVKACDAESLGTSGANGGNIITFNTAFRVWEEDGIFHFGTIYINTN